MCELFELTCGEVASDHRNFMAMEWVLRVTYNNRMSQSRTTTGIFLLILLAVIGYVLVTLPTGIVEQFHHAYQISPWVAYVYAGIVGFGSLLLASLCCSRSCCMCGRIRGRKRRIARGGI